jgi:hypothetical protein
MSWVELKAKARFGSWQQSQFKGATKDLILQLSRIHSDSVHINFHQLVPQRR